MSLHFRLKNLRLMRNLSQQQMADQLHMSRSNYTKLEAHPGNLRIELLQRIATVLTVPVALLFSWEQKPAETAWNDFDFMLEMAYIQYERRLTVVPYDDLTLEQMGLLASKGFASRETYEDTPLQGRLYTYGPTRALDDMLLELELSTLFKYHLIEHPRWLERWQQHLERQAERQAQPSRLVDLTAPRLTGPPEIDERQYLIVFSILLYMPDDSEQWLELALRDIPPTLDEEQALEQLIVSRGAKDGELMSFSYDGYTMQHDIVTDIYAPLA